MPEIRVTGTLEVEDDEYDPDHSFGLTDEAYEYYTVLFEALTDVQFRKVD